MRVRSWGKDVYFTATGFSLGGWRDYNRQEAERAQLNFGWRQGAGWINRVYLGVLRSRVEVTGVQTLAKIAAGDRSANPMTLLAQVERETSQYRFGDRIARQFAHGGCFAAGVGIAYAKVDFT